MKDGLAGCQGRIAATVMKPESSMIAQGPRIAEVGLLDLHDTALVILSPHLRRLVYLSCAFEGVHKSTL